VHLKDEELTVLKLRVLEPVLIRGKDAQEVYEELEAPLVDARDLENGIDHAVTHRVGGRDHFLLVVLVHFAEYAFRVAEDLKLLYLVLLL